MLFNEPYDDTYVVSFHEMHPTNLLKILNMNYQQVGQANNDATEAERQVEKGLKDLKVIMDELGGVTQINDTVLDALRKLIYCKFNSKNVYKRSSFKTFFQRYIYCAIKLNFFSVYYEQVWVLLKLLLSTENSINEAEIELKQVDLDGRIKALNEAKNNHQK